MPGMRFGLAAALTTLFALAGCCPFWDRWCGHHHPQPCCCVPCNPAPVCCPTSYSTPPVPVANAPAGPQWQRTDNRQPACCPPQ